MVPSPRWENKSQQIVESTCERPMTLPVPPDKTADPPYLSSIGFWHGACHTQGRCANEIHVETNPVGAGPKKKTEDKSEHQGSD